MTDAEVPEADALDQRRDAHPNPPRDELPPQLPPEASAADAIDQAREVVLDEDELR